MLSPNENRWRWLVRLAWFSVVLAVCSAMVVISVATRSDVRDSQDKFAQCTVAILFVPPDVRAKLTDEKVAKACDIDVEKVREIRDRLRA